MRHGRSIQIGSSGPHEVVKASIPQPRGLGNKKDSPINVVDRNQDHFATSFEREIPPANGGRSRGASPSDMTLSGKASGQILMLGGSNGAEEPPPSSGNMGGSRNDDAADRDGFAGIGAGPTHAETVSGSGRSDSRTPDGPSAQDQHAAPLTVFELAAEDRLSCPRCDAERGLDQPDGCDDPLCWGASEMQWHYELPATAPLTLAEKFRRHLDAPSPPPVPERVVRAELRAVVRCELSYTTRGSRGVGRTDERILAQVRYCRRQHSASIAAERRAVG